MTSKYLADPESACKAARRFSALDRFAALTSGGPVLMMTARFGRSPVRDAGYRICGRYRDLDLKLSWRLFGSLPDWGKRWPTERNAFAAGLILSAAGDPVVERSVGRCLADLAALGRPLLWGVIGRQPLWRPRFMLRPNGWTPAEMLPRPAEYARLDVARDAAEFRPVFDPILFSTDPDFFIFAARLRWREARHFDPVASRG